MRSDETNGGNPFRQMLGSHNLSEDVLGVLMAAHTQSTVSQYNVYVRKWLSFCKDNNVNMLSPTLKQVLDYLVLLYNNGSGYSVVNSAKSALSGILYNFDGVSLGKHPLVVKFMKGISRLRPPAVRYDVRWDPEILLSYFEKLPEDTELNLSQISYKLCSLLTLVTAQRVQTMKSIMLENIIMGDPVQIVLNSRLKTTNIHNRNPVLVLPVFLQRPKLCVVSCLRRYLEITKDIRKSEQLFVTINRPHDSASTKTISRWLVNTLELAGVDISKYTAHSFRMTGSSQALQNGVPSNIIMERVGWSSKSDTFAKFYSRPIEDRSKFVNAVLSKT